MSRSLYFFRAQQTSATRAYLPPGAPPCSGWLLVVLPPLWLAAWLGAAAVAATFLGVAWRAFRSSSTAWSFLPAPLSPAACLPMSSALAGTLPGAPTWIFIWSSASSCLLRGSSLAQRGSAGSLHRLFSAAMAASPRRSCVQGLARLGAHGHRSPPSAFYPHLYPLRCGPCAGL